MVPACRVREEDFDQCTQRRGGVSFSDGKLRLGSLNFDVSAASSGGKMET